MNEPTPPGPGHVPWAVASPGPDLDQQPTAERVQAGPGPVTGRRLPLGLVAAGGAVLIAGTAFAAGLAIADHGALQGTGTVGSSNGRPGPSCWSAPGRQSGGSGGGSGGSGGGTGDGRLPTGIGSLVAAGQIAAIDGATLVVVGHQGAVTVRTSADTQVEPDLGGTVSALQVGDLVFVAGSTASDGTVTATAIADRPFFAGIPGSSGIPGIPGSDA
jgi:Domain of unknown function (DUF5666)